MFPEVRLPATIIDGATMLFAAIFCVVCECLSVASHFFGSPLRRRPHACACTHKQAPQYSRSAHGDLPKPRGLILPHTAHGLTMCPDLFLAFTSSMQRQYLALGVCEFSVSLLLFLSLARFARVLLAADVLGIFPWEAVFCGPNDSIYLHCKKAPLLRD